MESSDYLSDPCGASSLPFWKTELVRIPDGVTVLRDDAFSERRPAGGDTPYFKLLHDLKTVREVRLPEGFALVPCGPEELVRHVAACYVREYLSLEELLAYQKRPVYRPELCLAVADGADGKLVASGLAGLDARIGEGFLEWIQVSPDYRRRGLGAFVVCELLRRLRGRADFVTVSGRLDSESDPFALYRACGFADPVIWHVVKA